MNCNENSGAQPSGDCLFAQSESTSRRHIACLVDRLTHSLGDAEPCHPSANCWRSSSLMHTEPSRLTTGYALD